MEQVKSIKLLGLINKIDRCKQSRHDAFISGVNERWYSLFEIRHSRHSQPYYTMASWPILANDVQVRNDGFYFIIVSITMNASLDWFCEGNCRMLTNSFNNYTLRIQHYNCSLKHSAMLPPFHHIIQSMQVNNSPVTYNDGISNWIQYIIRRRLPCQIIINSNQQYRFCKDY